MTRGSVRVPWMMPALGLSSAPAGVITMERPDARGRGVSTAGPENVVAAVRTVGPSDKQGRPGSPLRDAS